jgi:hypothetical protein
MLEGKRQNIGAIAAGSAGQAGLEFSPAPERPLVFVLTDGSSTKRYESTDQGTTWVETT